MTTTDTTQAQIVPDTTLPNNSTFTSQDNISTITQGTVADRNLFHSFQQFNIEEGQKADFVSPSTTIENILVRVTGGSRSEIMGTLGTSGLSNPNLFLINPYGIVFGPNANLEVGGSFVATTANAIMFGNQGFFSASVPNNPALLTVKPSAFLFNQITAGAITNRSETGLNVPAGQSLLLVGGDVSLDSGNLQAPGGRVEVAGVAGSGTVGLNVDSNNLRLDFPDSVARANVSLTNTNIFVEGGGSIAIRAQNLVVEGSFFNAGINSVSTQAGDITLDAIEAINIANSSLSNNVGFEAEGNTSSIYIKAGSLSLTDNTQVSASTFGRGNAGGVFVQANRSVDIVNSSISSNVDSVNAVGNTGGIHIKAGLLSLSDRAVLNANSFGQGETAGIFVQANHSVSVANSLIITQAGRTGAGNAGNINIQAEAISLTDGTFLETSTYREGRAGDVIIDAQNTVSADNSFISSDTLGSGNGGIIDIKARALNLTNGAELVSRTYGEGQGGKIQIQAFDSVSISGVNPDQGYSSGLITSSEQEGSGQGGDISVTTGSLRLSDGAVLNARTRSASRGGNITVNTNTLELTVGGQLLASTFSRGSAGEITVHATDSITISRSDPTFDERWTQFGLDIVDNDGSNSGLFARTSSDSTGNGGSINITTNNLDIANGAEISARSRGSGKAGGITINASQGLTLNNGQISATADLSDAGNITVSAPSIHLDNGALITANTQGGQGNINLNSVDLVLRHGSNITTNAQGTNVIGGNITIDTGVLAALENSDIAADSADFRGGNVTVTAQGIFGTEFRLVRTPESDITAKGANSSLSGTVTLNTPDIDPSQGLTNLPTEVVDASNQIDQTCSAGRGKVEQNQFTITGRGGMPTSPYEMLGDEEALEDVHPPAGFSSTTNSKPEVARAVTPQRATGNPKPQLVEANGWVINDKGQVVLTATPTTATPHDSWLRSATCPSS